VGDIRTMTFQGADDTGQLPAEENRIYFATEAEARQAGFRDTHEPEASSGSGNS
jgi:methylphosphotriester-DNA--protein-cysteine methyltransferase